MIPRRAQAAVQNALARQAAVALTGPRQVGKTTLAHAIAAATPSIYLDLEASEDRAKLADPNAFLSRYEDRLVVLDEIHRVPELFSTLRGLIDRGRRHGKKTSRFLILGSASMDLLRQSSESLAGRIAYVENGPFNILETATVGPIQARSGFVVDSRKAILPATTRIALSGARISSERTWSGMSRFLAHASPRRRWSGSGPCSRTSRRCF
jgi:predicted AAA+ superfamily ATPase